MSNLAGPLPVPYTSLNINTTTPEDFVYFSFDLDPVSDTMWIGHIVQAAGFPTPPPSAYVGHIITVDAYSTTFTVTDESVADKYSSVIYDRATDLLYAHYRDFGSSGIDRFNDPKNDLSDVTNIFDLPSDPDSLVYTMRTMADGLDRATKIMYFTLEKNTAFPTFPTVYTTALASVDMTATGQDFSDLTIIKTWPKWQRDDVTLIL